MKTFYITSTIEVEFESREVLDQIISANGSDQQREMLWDLWNNAEVDEVLKDNEGFSLCPKYKEKVLPDEEGKCSLCGEHDAS